jgi:HSP20 family protein
MDKVKHISLKSKDDPAKIYHLNFTSIQRSWTSNSKIWQPPTDLYEKLDVFIIQIEIAGMKDGEFTISSEGNLFTIQGARIGSYEQRAYHQMEIPHGEFISTLQLPSVIDYEKIEAHYEDGFLNIVLPKL